MRSFIAKSDTNPVWVGSRNLKMSFGAGLVLIWCLIKMKKALEGAGVCVVLHPISVIASQYDLVWRRDSAPVGR